MTKVLFTSILLLGGGVVIAAAPHASACAPTNVQGGTWGGTHQECLPDGSMYICDNGWAPFVGRIENCFWAPKGHPRNP